MRLVAAGLTTGLRRRRGRAGATARAAEDAAETEDRFEDATGATKPDRNLHAEAGQNAAGGADEVGQAARERNDADVLQLLQVISRVGLVAACVVTTRHDLEVLAETEGVVAGGQVELDVKQGSEDTVCRLPLVVGALDLREQLGSRLGEGFAVLIGEFISVMRVIRAVGSVQIADGGDETGDDLVAMGADEVVALHFRIVLEIPDDEIAAVLFLGRCEVFRVAEEGLDFGAEDGQAAGCGFGCSFHAGSDVVLVCC